MFSKSKSKRFKDSGSCAPAPGHYNIPDNMTAANLASFQKSDRWRTTAAKDQSLVTVNTSDSLSNSSGINKSFVTKLQSTVKKKTKALDELTSDNKSDLCRKSLEADVEFQQSKVNALLQKIKSLETQVEGSRTHSLDIERNNEKLHNIINDLRQEKCILVTQNEALEENIKILSGEKMGLKDKLDQSVLIAQKDQQDQENVYRNEREHLIERLTMSQDLNCDFRLQLESVESSMTENLRGLSDKYESLEQTLDNVQTDYKSKLERSNSLLEKVKQAHESSKNDLTVMQNVYNEMKEDYELYKIEVLKSKGEYEEAELRLKNELQAYQTKEKELISAKNDVALSYSKEQNKNKDLTEQLGGLKEKLKALRSDIVFFKEHHGKEKTELAVVLSETIQDIEHDKKKCLDAVADETERLNLEIENKKEFVHRLESEVSRLQTALNEERHEAQKRRFIYSRDLEESQKKLQLAKLQIKSLQENSAIFDEEKIRDLEEQSRRWQVKFNNLESKVGPFMSQLEQFEFEKQSLLNENAFNQSEMSKLSDKYAQILGHQNNKQKIHHIRKLKEENLSLKAEVLKLRADLAREKKRKNHVESKSAEQKKINHSMPFQQEGKENTTSRAPLKQTNS